MTKGMKTVIYPVKDLARAKAIYRQLLDVEPYMDEPYFVGYNADGYDIGLDPNGHAQGMTGPVTYWRVVDLEAATAALVAAGAGEHQAPRDVGGGSRIASVTDPDGNVIGLMQGA